MAERKNMSKITTTTTLSAATTNNPEPSFFLFTYQTGSKWQLTVRSAPIPGAHCVVKIDDSTDKNWLSMITSVNPPKDKKIKDLIPLDVWRGPLAAFLAPTQSTGIEKEEYKIDEKHTPKYHSLISEGMQLEYLQTIASWFQPDKKTDPKNTSGFFQHCNSDQNASPVESTILLDAALNADLNVITMMFANKSDDNIKALLSQ